MWQRVKADWIVRAEQNNRTIPIYSTAILTKEHASSYGDSDNDDIDFYAADSGNDEDNDYNDDEHVIRGETDINSMTDVPVVRDEIVVAVSDVAKETLT